MPKAVSLELDRDKVQHYIMATHGIGHVLLYGPPGTGKTTLSMGCAQPGQQITEITLRGDQSDYAIWGQDVPVTDGQGGVSLTWRRGPLLEAIIRGDLVVINEINKMSQDISDRMHMLLDSWTVAQDTLPDGTVVRIHPATRVIATMNGIVEELPEPVLDRFALRMSVHMPSTEQLERLDADIRQLCTENYANADPVQGPPITYRNLLNFCSTRAAIGDDRLAAMLVLGDKDKAVSFIEQIVMLKQKSSLERQQWVRNLVTALTAHLQQQLFKDQLQVLTSTVAEHVKQQLRAEYEALVGNA